MRQNMRKCTCILLKDVNRHSIIKIRYNKYDLMGVAWVSGPLP